MDSILLTTVLAFVVVATVQLTSSLPGGERGLLLFEKACPIYSHSQTSRTQTAPEAYGLGIAGRRTDHDVSSTVIA